MATDGSGFPHCLFRTCVYSYHIIVTIPVNSVRVVPDLYVYVDVGHGLNNRVLPTESRRVFDPGALGLGYQEHALNLELSKKIVAHLEAMDIQYFLNDDGGY